MLPIAGPPVSDWALDPTTGDLALPNGRVVLATGDDAIAQDWALRLGRIMGEWFRDRSKGIDVGATTGKPTRGRELAIRAEVRRETLAVRGLVGIRGMTLSLDRATRALVVRVLAVKSAGGVLELESAGLGTPEAS